MIKESPIITEGKGLESIAKCDHCGITIFTCESLQWHDTELLYSPLLCEQCGRKHSKDVGEDVKKIELLEKEIEELKNLA